MRWSWKPASVTLPLLLAIVFASVASACKRSEAGAPAADVVASEHGFSPASLRLTQGGPGSHAAVTFVRTTDKTCATEVVFPDLNLQRDLPLGKVVSVEVPTDSSRTLTFQCGMGMYKGALVVTSK
jgi:plastocyanin domain-containing protein